MIMETGNSKDEKINTNIHLDCDEGWGGGGGGGVGGGGVEHKSPLLFQNMLKL